MDKPSDMLGALVVVESKHRSRIYAVRQFLTGLKKIVTLQQIADRPFSVRHDEALLAAASA